MVFPDRVKRLALTLDYTKGQALDYSVIDQPQKRSTFLFVLKLILSLVANCASTIKHNREDSFLQSFFPLRCATAIVPIIMVTRRSILDCLCGKQTLNAQQYSSEPITKNKTFFFF